MWDTLQMLIYKNDSKAALKYMFREQLGVDTISYFPPSESINLDWHQIFGCYKINGRSKMICTSYSMIEGDLSLCPVEQLY
jgi:hypothetical protein